MARPFRPGDRVAILSQGNRQATIDRVGETTWDNAPAVVIGGVLHPERDIAHWDHNVGEKP